MPTCQIDEVQLGKAHVCDARVGLPLMRLDDSREHAAFEAIIAESSLISPQTKPAALEQALTVHGSNVIHQVCHGQYCAASLQPPRPPCPHLWEREDRSFMRVAAVWRLAEPLWMRRITSSAACRPRGAAAGAQGLEALLGEQAQPGVSATLARQLLLPKPSCPERAVP